MSNLSTKEQLLTFPLLSPLPPFIPPFLLVPPYFYFSLNPELVLESFTKGIRGGNVLPLSNKFQKVLQEQCSKTENKTIPYHSSHGNQN